MDPAKGLRDRHQRPPADCRRISEAASLAPAAVERQTREPPGLDQKPTLNIEEGRHLLAPRALPAPAIALFEDGSHPLSRRLVSRSQSYSRPLGDRFPSTELETQPASGSGRAAAPLETSFETSCSCFLRLRS